MSDTLFRRPAILAALISVFLSVSCGSPGSGNRAAAVTAGPEARIGPDTRLSQALTLLRAEFDSAVSSGLDDNGVRNLERAEIVSDRLLETRLPFAWLSADSYSLEARLRQIQSLSDRAISLRAGGARREDVIAQIREVVDNLDRLRSEIAAGGTAAPQPVDQLLIRLDTARR